MPTINMTDEQAKFVREVIEAKQDDSQKRAERTDKKSTERHKLYEVMLCGQVLALLPDGGNGNLPGVD